MNEEQTSPDAGGEPAAGDADAPESGPRRSLLQRISGFASWLALLLAALALAASGYDFVRDRLTAGDSAANTQELRNLTASVRATQDSVASLEQQIDALTGLDAERNAAIAAVREALDARLRNIEAMPGRVAALEGSLASLQGISAGARDAWLLAEAEYYMQIANAQLQLAGNPELARQALTHADERIVQLADPRLTGVRQALSDELRSLEVLEKPDVAGITLTLASLAGVIDSLPLRQDIADFEAADDDGTIDPELTGLARVRASFARALDRAIEIDDIGDVEMPFVPPDARYFLRANLALKLQIARLALLRGEEDVFRQSLDDANAWLSEYYAQDSAAVQSAEETIDGIRSSVVQVSVPDISQSLRMLRQVRTLYEAGAEPEVAEDPPAQ